MDSLATQVKRSETRCTRLRFDPFFRGHAHIDTRRREPYLLGEPYTTIITQALRLRYQLLPAWYTAFHEAAVDELPIVRPQYYVHPSDEKHLRSMINYTWSVSEAGHNEGAESVDIYISDEENYFDYFKYTVYQGASKTHKVVRR